MTKKPKTLKDLEPIFLQGCPKEAPLDDEYSNGYCVAVGWTTKKLKAEAIKWVKDKFTWDYSYSTSPSDATEIVIKHRQKQAFMDFFNLTDEEISAPNNRKVDKGEKS